MRAQPPGSRIISSAIGAGRGLVAMGAGGSTRSAAISLVAPVLELASTVLVIESGTGGGAGATAAFLGRTVNKPSDTAAAAATPAPHTIRGRRCVTGRFGSAIAVRPD